MLPCLDTLRDVDPAFACQESDAAYLPDVRADRLVRGLLHWIYSVAPPPAAGSAAPAPAAASSTLLALSRLIHGQHPAVELLTMHRRDGRLSVLLGRKVDEGEAARLTGFAVGH